MVFVGVWQGWDVINICVIVICDVNVDMVFVYYWLLVVLEIDQFVRWLGEEGYGVVILMKVVVLGVLWLCCVSIKVNLNCVSGFELIELLVEDDFQVLEVIIIDDGVVYQFGWGFFE